MSVTLQSYWIFLLVMRTFKISSLSNFQICNTVLITITARLYIMSPWHSFYNSKFIPFYPLHPFGPSSHPLATTNCSLYLWACFVFCISHISEIIQYLSFSVWLMSLTIMPSRLIQAVTNDRIFSFLWLNNTPLCAYVCVWYIYISHIFYFFLLLWICLVFIYLFFNFLLYIGV